MRALALLIVLASCAPISTIGSYNRPPSICSHTNVRGVRVEMVLQDSERHTEYVGNADPGGHVCANWRLPGDRGRWGTVTLGARSLPDTSWDLWFQAWALR